MDQYFFLILLVIEFCGVTLGLTKLFHIIFQLESVVFFFLVSLIYKKKKKLKFKHIQYRVQQTSTLHCSQSKEQL